MDDFFFSPHLHTMHNTDPIKGKGVEKVGRTFGNGDLNVEDDYPSPEPVCDRDRAGRVTQHHARGVTALVWAHQGQGHVVTSEPWGVDNQSINHSVNQCHHQTMGAGNQSNQSIINCINITGKSLEAANQSINKYLNQSIIYSLHQRGQQTLGRSN